jgi:hypothetical protein
MRTRKLLHTLSFREVLLPTLLSMVHFGGRFGNSMLHCAPSVYYGLEVRNDIIGNDRRRRPHYLSLAQPPRGHSSLSVG